MNASLQDWLGRHSGPLVAVHDFDADGICAAALWARATGGELLPVPSRQRLPVPEARAAGVFLLDVSCPEERFPWSQATVVIDHHPPAARPPEGLIFSGYDRRPPTCTALMVQELFWPDSEEGGWMAALGALSDLGDDLPFPVVRQALERHGKARLRDLVALLNSAHRAAGDCVQATRALLAHDSPEEVLRSHSPEMAYLRECREKVRRRLGEARQIQPRMVAGLALVEFSSDCPVQSLVAQIWRNRLPGRVVLAVNHRSDRAEVHVSARASRGVNVIARLAELGIPLQGHPGSAGGVFPPERWDELAGGPLRSIS